MGIDWTECSATEPVLDRMNGIPVVKGSRMPADDVVENYESGSSVEEISQNFGLKARDIGAILDYAAAHKPVYCGQ